MADLRAVLGTAPVKEFSGTVYRIVPSRFGGNPASMRGSLLYGARYNIRGYFGALYTSLSPQTARREMERYFTRPPTEGFVQASIGLRLHRVLDLTDRKLLRKAGVSWSQLIEARHLTTQEIGLRAWESGIEALLVPSAAMPTEPNLAVFLDNQSLRWRVELTGIGLPAG